MSIVKSAPKKVMPKKSVLYDLGKFSISVADPNPDPPDPRVFGPPGSGSISQSYVSVSGNQWSLPTQAPSIQRQAEGRVRGGVSVGWRNEVYETFPLSPNFSYRAVCPPPGQYRYGTPVP
jgi:hypothetical protein